MFKIPNFDKGNCPALDRAELLTSEMELVLGGKQNYFWGNEAKHQKFGVLPQKIRFQTREKKSFAGNVFVIHAHWK